MKKVIILLILCCVLFGVPALNCSAEAPNKEGSDVSLNAEQKGNLVDFYKQRDEELNKRISRNKNNMNDGKQFLSGNTKVDIALPLPEQRSTPWHTTKDPYYEDVAVYAIPNSAKPTIEDVNEKALYERYPYSSYPNVKTHLPAPFEFDNIEEGNILNQKDILDISQYLHDDGQLLWDAPEGDWTIVRMGIRVTGAGTRPAPEPALGLESNKLDTTAFANHLKN